MARTMLWIGAGITLAFVLIALLAPVIAPYDFDTFRANGQRFPQLAPPSWDHLMGTNVQSTDVLSRIIWGTQTELKVVIVSMFFSIGVGVPLGLLSGYFGGWLDRVLVLLMPRSTYSALRHVMRVGLRPGTRLAQWYDASRTPGLGTVYSASLTARAAGSARL